MKIKDLIGKRISFTNANLERENEVLHGRVLKSHGGFVCIVHNYLPLNRGFNGSWEIKTSHHEKIKKDTSYKRGWSFDRNHEPEVGYGGFNNIKVIED